MILRDELEYFREINLLEPMTVAFVCAGLAPDGSKFLVRNEFFRHDGRPAARVTSLGAWMDLSARRLVVPPPALLAGLQALARTDDYRELKGV